MIPYCIMAIENDDDREFMSNLYLDYRKLMYSEIQKILKNEHDTEDVLQDVLEKLIDKIALLRSRTREQLVNYIISACKFTAFNYRRDDKRRYEMGYEDFIELPDADHDGHEVEIRLIKDEELQALRQVLPQLDSRTQYLLKGYYFLEKSVTELGAELGIKPDSVRMYLTRARKKAFALLQKDIVPNSRK